MMCAILQLDNLSHSYYSNLDRDGLCLAPAEVIPLLNDLDDNLPEGMCVAVTVDENNDVALMEYMDCDGNSRPMPYNSMKAYCQVYGIGMAIPEYVGPYTLEAARTAFEDCGDYMTIIPVMEEGEVLCGS